MSDHITVTGLIATAPRHIVTSEGLAITSFRLASSQRRFDRGRSEWVDGETNWYTVTGFRKLAINAAASLQKGDRVVVSGRLRIRDWSQGERAGTTVEIEADALGHDVAWGVSRFTRAASTGSADQAATDPGADPGEGAWDEAAGVSAGADAAALDHWPAPEDADLAAADLVAS